VKIGAIGARPRKQIAPSASHRTQGIVAKDCFKSARLGAHHSGPFF